MYVFLLMWRMAAAGATQDIDIGTPLAAAALAMFFLLASL